MYFSYGNIKSLVQGATVGREKFTGKEFDTEGGSGSTGGMNLDYFGARYYDADLGMWISPDAFRQHHSPYTYAGNDPINRVDPDGNLDRIHHPDGTVTFENTPLLGVTDYNSWGGLWAPGLEDHTGTFLFGAAAKVMSNIFRLIRLSDKVSGPAPVQGPPEAIVRTSNRPGNQQSVELRYPDGRVKDINTGRVKEWVPNTHPQAPNGATNKVIFENALPGSKGAKRAPTAEELQILRNATGN